MISLQLYCVHYTRLRLAACRIGRKPWQSRFRMCGKLVPTQPGRHQGSYAEIQYVSVQSGTSLFSAVQKFE